MKRKWLFVLGVVVILIVVGVGIVGFRAYQQRQEELRMEEIREAEREAERETEREAEEAAAFELANTYVRLSYAFGIGYEFEGELEDLNEYAIEFIHRSLGTFGPLFRNSEPNRHGIWVRAYLPLRFYYHRTGIYLPYQKAVIDYFAEEFEPDGTLRLYNNGHHPEMEAFVTWMWEDQRREELLEYIETIDFIYGNYFFDHQDDGFALQSFSQLSPQMLDALARSESDPDYELDLTSIQEAGY